MRQPLRLLAFIVAFVLTEISASSALEQVDNSTLLKAIGKSAFPTHNRNTSGREIVERSGGLKTMPYFSPGQTIYDRQLTVKETDGRRTVHIMVYHYKSNRGDGIDVEHTLSVRDFDDPEIELSRDEQRISLPVRKGVTSTLTVRAFEDEPERRYKIEMKDASGRITAEEIR